MELDLSTLSQPGAAASGAMPQPNLPDPPAEVMQPATAMPNVGGPAPDRGINPQVPPAPPETPNVGGHTRLLSMVHALAIGMSNASKSLSTGGREGGASGVISDMAAEQNQKLQAQQAGQAAKNAQLQQQVLTGELNRQTSQNHILLQTAPDEINASHLKVQTGNLELQQKAQDMFDTKGQVPAGWTVDPNSGQVSQSGQGQTPTSGAASSGTTTPNVLPGVTPSASGTAPTGTAPSVFNTRQNMLLDAAGQELKDAKGNDDPLVTAARQIVANPNSTPVQKRQAVIAVQNKAGLSADVVKNLTAKADLATKQQSAASGSPVGKLSTPEALASPGAQAAIQAKIGDPNTDPNDIPRLRALLPQAAVAQFNAETIKRREARNTQIINQGDPTVAGHLLADRSLTLDELKSRQVTPEFIVAAVTAAQKYDKTFKAPEATAQSRIAASPANSQFFGNTDSLLVNGGTLDQLAQAHAALGNTSIPFANKLENWRKAALGQGPQAAFAAAALGVADDGSKVMAGGTGSDASRQQFLDIIARDLSNAGMAASIGQVRKQITSQRNGRISTNPYLQDMYPDPSTRQETPGLAGTQAAAPTIVGVIHKNGIVTGHRMSDGSVRR